MTSVAERKRKRKRSNPADATSSNMTSGLESHANKQRHEVSVPKRRYSNQCQRGGTQISAKEEVLESAPKRRCSNRSKDKTSLSRYLRP